MFKKKKKEVVEVRPKKKKKKFDLVGALIILGMLVGYYALMYPTMADLLNKAYNQNAILAYNNAMRSYSNEEIESMLEACHEYNEEIAEYQETHVFRYQGPTASDSEYTSLPTTGSEIGTLRIPDINVQVSVAHGTSDSTLQGTAGHLYGSSLPVDGENVHSIIAAHSALSSAKLFTDLNKLKVGQKFYVTVLNQEYEYEIDQIKTVLPEDDYQYEQIEDGQNYVTLYTCTPYGVNTHRLLVRGKMVGQKTVETNGNSKWMDILKVVWAFTKFGLVLLAPAIATGIYSWYLQYKEKKKEKQKLVTKVITSVPEGTEIQSTTEVVEREQDEVIHKKE